MGAVRQAIELLALALSGGVVLLGLLLASVQVALADTATPPAAGESNNLLFGIIALGVLSAVVVLTRPRRGKQ